MKAISFFSYKGGVGRTLALTNMASRLVEFGKSVMILDFDLEAPGVPYKLGKYIKPENIKTGLVDYIFEFTDKGHLDDIKKYVVKVPRGGNLDAPMWLLPAGNNNGNEYWKKLSAISWNDLFYKEGGKGLRFFIDLKERIKKEYNPDFLLIDSRTGISELSGISLQILADEVVVLLVNNQENISGTEKVLSFIGGTNAQNKPIHIVLTRVPKLTTPTRKNIEYKLKEAIKKKFTDALKSNVVDISTIHNDERIQMNENLAFSNRVDSRTYESIGIYNEHVKLFETIFRKHFNESDWQKNDNRVKAEEYFEKARISNDPESKILNLGKSIEHFPYKGEYFTARAEVNMMTKNIKESIVDLEKAINLDSNNFKNYLYLATCYFESGELEKALSFIDNSLKLSPAVLHSAVLKTTILNKQGKEQESIDYLKSLISEDPNSAALLNTRADTYRRIGNIELALVDIHKAISIDVNAVYFATLAEIKAAQDNSEEFYLNLTTSLNMGIDVLLLRSAKEAYEKFRYEERFIKLLESYGIDSEDIFNDKPINKSEGFDEESAD